MEPHEKNNAPTCWCPPPGPHPLLSVVYYDLKRRSVWEGDRISRIALTPAGFRHTLSIVTTEARRRRTPTRLYTADIRQAVHRATPRFMSGVRAGQRAGTWLASRPRVDADRIGNRSVSSSGNGSIVRDRGLFDKLRLWRSGLRSMASWL